MIIELLSNIEAKGIVLLKDGDSLRFEAPKGTLTDDIIDTVRQHKSKLLKLLEIDNETPYKKLRTPSKNIPASFPLTPLQQGYWIGEKPFFKQNCKAYYYNEYDIKNLKIDRLEKALNRVVEAHDALRISIDEYGKQHINTYEYQFIDCRDLRSSSNEEAQKTLEEYRRNIELELPPLSSGQPYLFTVHHMPNASIFSFTFRLIAVDATSFNLLIDKILNSYHQNTQTTFNQNRIKHSYYDYIRFLDSRKNTPIYRKSLNYWNKKISSLPSAPQLPYQEENKDQNTDLETFQRYRGRLNQTTWKKLRFKAQKFGLTINSVLCSVFADVIQRWSTSADFTLNVLVSDRPIQVPGMESLVGNCSTTVLLEVHQNANTFIKRAENIRTQLYNDIEYSSVAGVELIRLLQKQNNTGDQPPMPVVFTSGIDIAGAVTDFTVHNADWTLTQTHLKTPQVWLDHQVYVDDGELIYNWDFIPKIFPSDVISSMFNYYEMYLQALADSDQYWHTNASAFPLSSKQLRPRDIFNHFNAPLPQRKLHQGFVDMALHWPDRLALITEEGQFSYQQLYSRAISIGYAINARLSPDISSTNQVIGICCAKGAEQIAAVLATLITGHTYLPVDVKTPKSRVKYIAQHSEAAAMLVDKQGINLVDDSFPAGIINLSQINTDTSLTINSPPGKLTDRAYIIYTSGSTGNPKGVVINHQAAMNTIEDMVRRFGMTPNDRVLGLSALNFDLSVYDIFATLSNGAVLVLPPEIDTPDPSTWAPIIQDKKITIWNSVPALMEITLEYLREKAFQALSSVRLVMMSGDWIPPKLITQLNHYKTTVHTVALGGATEASIWSNYYNIDDKPKDWNSIPYGTPLTNQSMFILDEYMSHCPDWVIGDLYIGGEGLADEYLNNEKNTNSSFIFHPETQQRLYRTGDLARIRQGLIEFIGRKDFQVKVRGFRVELGEIEAQMNSVEHVEQAVVIMIGQSSSQQQLIGFYTSKNSSDGIEKVIQHKLTDTLPHYMVPSLFVKLDNIPLSNNAKVDRKKLIELLPSEKNTLGKTFPPKTATEKKLHDLWSHLLPDTSFGITDNFFEIGGNSLTAVRLTNNIEDTFSVTLPLDVFFKHSTISALSEKINKELDVSHKQIKESLDSPEDQSPVVLISPSQGDKKLFLIHPVGGNVLCYLPLASYLKEFQCYGIQASFTNNSSESFPNLDALADYYSVLIQQQIEYITSEPIYIGGWSMGAVLTIIVANKLKESGYNLAKLLLVDPWVSDGSELNAYSTTIAVQGFFTDIIGKQHQSVYPPREPEENTKDYISRCLLNAKNASDNSVAKLFGGIDENQLNNLFSVYYKNSQLLRCFPVPETELAFHLVQTNTKQNSFFPGLVPLSDTQQYLAKDVNVNTSVTFLEHLSHWDIIQAEHVIPVATAWEKSFREYT